MAAATTPIPNASYVSLVDASNNQVGSSVANPLIVTLAGTGQASTFLNLASDGLGISVYAPVVGTPLLLSNGSTFDRGRTPSVFKTGVVTATGDTTIWTPAGGKKFRLMRFMLQVTANASQSVAGLLEFIFKDNTTAIGLGHSFYVPGAAGTVFGEQGGTWVDLGNGYLSAAADQVLKMNLSAALATGECRYILAGTEE